ncbi:unnamed protein product [Arctia plantaginis]|uniref:UDP-glycosyltransferase n=1 Tax=Arctia plantaginis TaxID=874455 RepID=A0A8S1BJC3_ARCPL|nr:unnamed protein product [Arctia plantaginis]
MIAIQLAILILLFIKCEAGKILAVSPTPSIHHQRIFYPLVKGLAKIGHEVIFIAANPAYPDGKSSQNFQYINLEHLSNGILKKYANLSQEYINTLINIDSNAIYSIMLQLFEEQMKSEEVQNLIKHHKSFDLLLLPAWFRPAMVWCHIYKAPVIKLSTYGLGFSNPENFGVPIHPILYPDNMSKRIYNLNVWEIFTEVYNMIKYNEVFHDYEDEENKILKRIFGPDVPLLSELEGNAEMLLLNSNSFWERNRPLPLNVVYFGNRDYSTAKELPKDLKFFLDSSQGAIYVNLGDSESLRLPTAILEIFLEVFSGLPYNVLWRVDFEGLKDLPQNVMMKKIFSEVDIFRHPNLKLIITHGDLQTTTEAIEAGVPLIGLRKLGDQMFNMEHYTQYGIGLHLDGNAISKEEFRSSVLKVIEDPSYKDNILRLRKLINDTRTPALDRAILWTEYVIKHSSMAHLKSSASNKTWTEYYELELISIVISTIIILTSVFWLLLKIFLEKIDAIIAYQARTEEI